MHEKLSCVPLMHKLCYASRPHKMFHIRSVIRDVYINDYRKNNEGWGICRVGLHGYIQRKHVRASILEIKGTCALVWSKYFDEGNSLVNLLVARNRKECLEIHSCCLFLLQRPADAAVPEKWWVAFANPL